MHLNVRVIKCVALFPDNKNENWSFNVLYNRVNIIYLLYVSALWREKPLLFDIVDKS